MMTLTVSFFFKADLNGIDGADDTLRMIHACNTGLTSHYVRVHTCYSYNKIDLVLARFWH